MHLARHITKFNPFTTIALCLLVAAGCNAFEFMRSGRTADPGRVLEDLQMAMEPVILDGADAEETAERLEITNEAAPYYVTPYDSTMRISAEDFARRTQRSATDLPIDPR